MRKMVNVFLVWIVGAVCPGLASMSLALAAEAPQHAIPFSMKEKKGGERVYLGTITMKGKYYVDESGMLFFTPDKQYMKDLPEFGQRSTLGFSNQALAIEELGIKKILQSVDLSKNCGVHGSAVFSIKGLTVGDGPSNKWYTTEYISSRSRSKGVLLACAQH